jgi:hypothetical protein
MRRNSHHSIVAYISSQGTVCHTTDAAISVVEEFRYIVYQRGEQFYVLDKWIFQSGMSYETLEDAVAATVMQIALKGDA